MGVYMNTCKHVCIYTCRHTGIYGYDKSRTAERLHWESGAGNVYNN